MSKRRQAVSPKRRAQYAGLARWIADVYGEYLTRDLCAAKIEECLLSAHRFGVQSERERQRRGR